MKKLLKMLLRIIPYISAIIVGILLYLIAIRFNDDFKSLLINISASFIGIPLIYFAYESIKTRTNKRLNVEIIEYSKMQIDQEILGMINQLMKYVLPYQEVDKTIKGINAFMNLSQDEISTKLQNNSFIAFQLIKEWEVQGDNLKELLKNPLIISTIDNDRIITIIKLLKNIMLFDHDEKVEYFIYYTNEKDDKYFVVDGKSLNPENIAFPNRLILMEKIDNEHSRVIDFGDFKKYNKDNLLKKCKYLEAYYKYIAENIYQFISELNTWIEQNNNKLLIDTKKIRYRVIED